MTLSNDVEIVTPPIETLVDVIKEDDRVCPVKGCGKKMRNSSALRLHVVKSHGIGRLAKREVNGKIVVFACPILGCPHHAESERKHFFKILYRLKLHFQRQHGEKNFRCVKCDKPFGLLEGRERHQAICGQLFYCICGVFYTTVNAVLAHAAKSGDGHSLVGEESPKKKLKLATDNTKSSEVNVPAFLYIPIPQALPLKTTFSKNQVEILPKVEKIANINNLADSHGRLKEAAFAKRFPVKNHIPVQCKSSSVDKSFANRSSLKVSKLSKNNHTIGFRNTLSPPVVSGENKPAQSSSLTSSSLTSSSSPSVESSKPLSKYEQLMSYLDSPETQEVLSDRGLLTLTLIVKHRNRLQNMKKSQQKKSKNEVLPGVKELKDILTGNSLYKKAAKQSNNANNYFFPHNDASKEDLSKFDEFLAYLVSPEVQEVLSDPKLLQMTLRKQQRLRQMRKLGKLFSADPKMTKHVVEAKIVEKMYSNSLNENAILPNVNKINVPVNSNIPHKELGETNATSNTFRTSDFSAQCQLPSSSDSLVLDGETQTENMLLWFSNLTDSCSTETQTIDQILLGSEFVDNCSAETQTSDQALINSVTPMLFDKSIQLEDFMKDGCLDGCHSISMGTQTNNSVDWITEDFHPVFSNEHNSSATQTEPNFELFDIDFSIEKKDESSQFSLNPFTFGTQSFSIDNQTTSMINDPVQFDADQNSLSSMLDISTNTFGTQTFDVDENISSSTLDFSKNTSGTQTFSANGNSSYSLLDIPTNTFGTQTFVIDEKPLNSVLGITKSTFGTQTFAGQAKSSFGTQTLEYLNDFMIGGGDSLKNSETQTAVSFSELLELFLKDEYWN